MGSTRFNLPITLVVFLKRTQGQSLFFISGVGAAFPLEMGCLRNGSFPVYAGPMSLLDVRWTHLGSRNVLKGHQGDTKQPLIC